MANIASVDIDIPPISTIHCLPTSLSQFLKDNKRQRQQKIKNQGQWQQKQEQKVKGSNRIVNFFQPEA